MTDIMVTIHMKNHDVILTVVAESIALLLDLNGIRLFVSIWRTVFAALGLKLFPGKKRLTMELPHVSVISLMQIKSTIDDCTCNLCATW